MKKIITFVNDTPHADVEELSLTYQSSIFFSDNYYSEEHADEYEDIYHNSYLYSYIQGVNTDKNGIVFSSGMFRINYEDDKLSSSYIYMSDEEVTLYPSTNSNYASQNEYNFNIYHSDDIQLQPQNILYNSNVFTFSSSRTGFTLKVRNPKSASSTQILRYKISNNTSITTKINIVRETPNFDFESKKIYVNNNSYFNIPFTLSNNRNHNKINYHCDSTYIQHIGDLNFKAVNETAKDAYTTIWANIDTYNKTAYAYVIVAPAVKAESMSIVKYNNADNVSNNISVAGQQHITDHIIPGGVDAPMNYINYVPYETSHNDAAAGSGNTFKLKMFPDNVSHKNVQWFSTDPSTMKIINVNNNNNTIQVKYYKPGKVILYATHEYNNDNYLRAFMTITISGGVIITKIYPIETSTQNIIDGDPIQFTVGHEPADSELTLVFEGEGENYIDVYRDKYQVDKYNDNVYSYFNTYANVQNWGNDTVKSYIFNIAYTNMNTGIDEYASTQEINFYKLYSEPSTQNCTIRRNEGAPVNYPMIYYGDNVTFTYMYKCYPNNSSSDNSICIDLTHLKNNTSYNVVLRGNEVNTIINENNISLDKKSNSNYMAYINTYFNENDILNLQEGNYNLENSFSYDYNNLKTLEGTGKQNFYVKSPFIDTNILNVTYGYTGIIGSYNIMPSDGLISHTSANGARISLNNNNIRLNNALYIQNNYRIAYAVENRSYSSTGNFYIPIVPVEIQIQDENGNSITSYSYSLLENTTSTTIDLSYILLPNNNVVDFNKNCTVTVNNNTNYVSASIIENNGEYKLRIIKNSEVMQFNSNNICTTNITIQNDTSRCVANLQVIFTLNKIYIIVLNILDNPNELIYYNSNGNSTYKNRKIVTVEGQEFSVPSSTLTTSVTIHTISGAGNLNYTPTSLQIGPNNASGEFTFSASAKCNSTVGFAYLTGPGSNGNIPFNIKSYALPEGISNFTVNPSNEIYESQTVNFTMDTLKYGDMSPAMKTASYWFIYASENRFIKNSDFSYTFKCLSHNSSVPVEKYNNLTYGINAKYSPTGSIIKYTAPLYFMYTYFSYTADNIYANLNKDVYINVNAYMNPANINQIGFSYERGIYNNGLDKISIIDGNIIYDGIQLQSKYKEIKYKLKGTTSEYINTSSNSIDYKLFITYAGNTYCTPRGAIYHPGITNNINNGVLYYTNGNDNTNWKKSFGISYSKTGDWPQDYNGEWSYIYTSEGQYNNGTYSPSKNGIYQFAIQCDNVISNTKNITVHTLCDNFQLDETKSYLPIIVASGYPYTVYNKYQNVQANNSNEKIDTAPESYILSTNSVNISVNDKVITQNSFSNDPENVILTYTSGCYQNQTINYNVYSIKYGLTHSGGNLSAMRRTQYTLPGYIKGISGGTLSYIIGTNGYGALISGNKLNLTGVSTNDIGKEIDINTQFNYNASNSDRQYKFLNSDKIKILPYRNTTINGIDHHDIQEIVFMIVIDLSSQPDGRTYINGNYSLLRVIDQNNTIFEITIDSDIMYNFNTHQQTCELTLRIHDNVAGKVFEEFGKNQIYMYIQIEQNNSISRAGDTEYFSCGKSGDNLCIVVHEQKTNNSGLLPQQDITNENYPKLKFQDKIEFTSINYEIPPQEGSSALSFKSYGINENVYSSVYELQLYIG